MLINSRAARLPVRVKAGSPSLIRDVCLSAAYHTTDAEGLYCAARQIWLLNVLFGLFPTISVDPCDVRLPIAIAIATCLPIAKCHEGTRQPTTLASIGLPVTLCQAPLLH